MGDGQMTATAMGRVIILNNWEMCANMFATFEDSPDPAKFKMRYWGAASYLQTGYDDPCLDGYSFVFSRHSTGLRPEDQKIVTQKKQDICFLGKYRRVGHTGFCEA